MTGAAICTRIARHLSGRPLYIEPHALKAMLDAVGPRLGLAGADMQADASEFAQAKRVATVNRLAAVIEAEPVDVAGGMAEYGLTPDGIAVVPITGTLVDRYDWLAALCGFASYDSVKLALDAALADDRVNGILLDVDSPGGEAAGMLDVADRIRAAHQRKPVWAVANTLAASAAYALASAAGRLVLPRLASVGSIGVVAVHVDQSAADKEHGLKYTALYSGARKVDGWGHAPLSDEARERFQAQLDEARRKFAAAVADYRGLSLEAVMGTEAALYDDDAAVKAGLADAVMPLEAALAGLSEMIRSPGSAARTAAHHAAKPKEVDMADEKKPAGKLSAEQNDRKPDMPDEREDETEEAPAEGKPGKGKPEDGDKPEDKAAKAREAAAKIVALVEQAGRLCADIKPGRAAEFIKAGHSPEQVRATLWEEIAAKAPTITSQVMPDSKTTAGSVWDRVIAERFGQ